MENLHEFVEKVHDQQEKQANKKNAWRRPFKFVQLSSYV
ncbi:DUF4023 family protein, partial [Paenibacillus sp. 3LSP]